MHTIILGKSTLTDSLVAAAGIIAVESVSYLNYYEYFILFILNYISMFRIIWCCILNYNAIINVGNNT